MKNSIKGAQPCARPIWVARVLVLGGLSIGGVVHAACNASIPMTRPDSRYEQVALATPEGSEVRDKVTGLVWQRCAVGMQWSGTHCIGTATDFLWKEALEFARTATASTAATTSAWRVPNRMELLSLVERACTFPSINTTWLAEIPAGTLFFSSSIQLADYAGGVTVWVVNLDQGTFHGYPMDAVLRLRLVRFGS